MKIHATNPIQLATSSVTRRQVLALATVTLAGLGADSVRAGMPLPEPLSLEDQIKYHGRLIFTGRISCAVFLSPEITQKLFKPGGKIEPAELKLYERNELKTVEAGFLEIENASPVLLKKDVPAQEASELVTGTVYCYVEGLGRHRETDAYIASLVGSMAIFFFNGQAKKFGVSGTPMPFPLYLESGGSNWRDALPRSIGHLSNVTAIAKKLGFVESRQ